MARKRLTTLFRAVPGRWTPARARRGLSPNGDGAVYLAGDVGHAASYANPGHMPGSRIASVVAVEVADLDAALLAPDDVDLPDIAGYGWERIGWRRSIGVSGQCRYLGAIAPSSVRFIGHVEVSSGHWEGRGAR